MYIKIIVDDTIGAGIDYQFNCIKQEAQKIGLKAELMEET